MSQTQECGEETRDDENGEEDYEGGSEGGRGHTDVTLKRREDISTN